MVMNAQKAEDFIIQNKSIDFPRKYANRQFE